jgi:hypothetical protein
MKFPAAMQSTSAKLLLSLYIPTGMLLLTVLAISLRTGIPVAMFTRDPADITDSSPFLGVLSNIGILLWCASATICFFAALFLKRKNAGGMAVFFFISGLITSMLLADDLFLLHERIFPEYFHWRQRYVYLSYVAITFVYLLRFRATILKSNFVTLVLAFGFFFLSIVIDGIAVKYEGFRPFHHFFEDGFKLFGLSSWLGYFGDTALHALAPSDGA